MSEAQTVNIEFSLVWDSELVTHRDSLFVPNVDFRRDLLPGMMHQLLPDTPPGQAVTESFAAGVLVEAWKASDRRRAPLDAFNRNYRSLNLEPRRGRYYPGDVLADAIGISTGDLRPFRIVDIEDDMLTIDLNHPLSTYPLAIEAVMLDSPEGSEPRDGSRRSIAEMLTGSGAGLQARNVQGLAFEFPLKRVDGSDDSLFYSMPRMVEHIDDKAGAILKSIYCRDLHPGARVLDLMSSWTSHIDDNICDLSVSGIGMNMVEMEANPLLSERIVQDINEQAALPFDDGSIDVVLCSLSVEYLVSPLDVLNEVRRVLKPGGFFINSFSERWFPTKVVAAWTGMHPFERVGMVLDYYIATGFDSLSTESVRGYARPGDDKYHGLSPHSDPVYIVKGTKPAA